MSPSQEGLSIFGVKKSSFIQENFRLSHGVNEIWFYRSFNEFSFYWDFRYPNPI